MTDTLNQTLVTKFTDMVNHKAQQTESFLRGRVMTKPVTGNKFDWQNLAPGEDTEITSRYEAVAFGAPQHERRGAIIKSYTQTWGVDRNDDLQSLVDLESPYVEALAKTMARRFDHVAADAALGAVLTGADLTGSTAFAGTTVTAGSGLIYDKLREVLAAFYSKGVGLSADEKLFLAVTEKEHSTMLDQAELTSGDYRSDYTIEKGRVATALGMQVIIFPSAPSTGSSIINAQSGTVNNCFAFASSGICVGINSEIEVRVEPRYDLVDTKQVKAIFRLGALRTDDAKIVKIDVTNS